MEATTLKRRPSTPTLSFNPDWEDAYFFMEYIGGAICLICNRKLQVLKRFNLQRHYLTLHAKDYSNLKSEERAAEIQRLKENFSSQEEEEMKDTTNAESSVRVSYQIALEIATSLRCYSDGQFIKQCLIVAATEFTPTQVHQFESISLSPHTISRRIQDLADNLYEQLTVRAKKFIAYSIAIDESTDISSTAQLCIFIRGVNENLEVVEELLDLVPMKGTTTGLDVLNCVVESVESADITWDTLVSISTDGAPAMIGSKTGFVALLNEKLNRKIKSVHCIVHQENLCAKAINVSNVMSVVVKIVNKLRSHGLKHRQFKSFLEDLEHEYGDIPYYTEVRWLSRGKVLSRFFDLLEAITLFMEMNGDSVTELGDINWKCDLAFMADITEHLNCLNQTLQGKDKLITEMFGNIEAFKTKLSLWERQLSNGDTAHFPKLQSVIRTFDSSNMVRYVESLQLLHREFQERFKDLMSLKMDFHLFATPFSINVDDAAPEVQLELIDLNSDIELKDTYRNRKTLLDFYSRFPKSRFPRLHRRAATIISMFGSTYVCEKFFSAMKLSKGQQRANITNNNLKCTLRVKSSVSLTPNISDIIKNKMCRKSKHSSEKK